MLSLLWWDNLVDICSPRVNFSAQLKFAVFMLFCRQRGTNSNVLILIGLLSLTSENSLNHGLNWLILISYGKIQKTFFFSQLPDTFSPSPLLSSPLSSFPFFFTKREKFATHTHKEKDQVVSGKKKQDI